MSLEMERAKIQMGSFRGITYSNIKILFQPFKKITYFKDKL